VLTLDVVGGICRERVQAGGEARLGGREIGRGPALIELDTGRDQNLVLEHAAVLDAHTVAALESRPDALTLDIDQGDSGVRQHLRTGVGYAPGARRRRVDDGTHAAVDQRLGLSAVKLRLVNDGDVTLTKGRNVLGLAGESYGAHDPLRRRWQG
jgi:hypothetical protein